MIDSKEAVQEIQKLIVPDWGLSVMRKAQGLRVSEPAQRFLARAGNRSLGPPRLGYPVELGEDEEAFVPPNEQFLLLQASFPKLAAEIARAWDLLDGRPYTRGWVRKGFRAPGHPVVAVTRSRWFEAMFAQLAGIDQDVSWLAAWAPHVARLPDRYGCAESVAPLLISAIDAGGSVGREVLRTLQESASGTHEVGFMGAHVITSLLGCADPGAWDFMERMLLAAQREEGLRQAILESADDAHPGAFGRLLRVVLDNNLVRFSATVRAVDLWFGLMYDSMATKQAAAIVETVLLALEDERDRERMLGAKDPLQAYLALWSVAHADAPAAVGRAGRILREDRRADRRFVAANLLCQAGLPECRPLLIEAIGDSDLRVAAKAFEALSGISYDPMVSAESARGQDGDEAAFWALEGLLGRIKGPKAAFEPGAFEWTCRSIQAGDVLQCMMQVAPGSCYDSLASHAARMKPHTRAALANAVCGRPDRWSSRATPVAVDPKNIPPTARSLLLRFLGDAAQEVRAAAAAGLSAGPPRDDEVAVLEGLLDRSASDLRAGAIQRILAQSDPDALRSAERLVNDKSADRRRAGLEILRAMAKSGRSAEKAAEAAQAFRSSSKRMSKPEQALTAFADAWAGAANPPDRCTLRDALGLLDCAARIPGRMPPSAAHAPGLVERGRSLLNAITDRTGQTDRALGDRGLETLWSLHEFVRRYKDVELPEDKRSSDLEPILLGGMHFWRVAHVYRTHTREQNLARLPAQVRDLIVQWMTEREFASRGLPPRVESPGLELGWAWMQRVSADLRCKHGDHTWPAEGGGKPREAEFSVGCEYLLDWAIVLHADESLTDWMLDRAEEAAAHGRITRAVDIDDFLATHNGLKVYTPEFTSDWVGYLRRLPFPTIGPALERVFNLIRLSEDHAGAFAERIAARLTPLGRRPSQRGPDRYEPAAPASRFIQPDMDEFIAAWQLGFVNEQDLFQWAFLPDQVCADDYTATIRRVPRCRFLPALVERRAELRKIGREGPEGLDAAIAQAWSRVLEVEFARGDAPTEVSGLVHDVSPSGGADVVLRALQALGEQRLIRGHNWCDGSVSSVFSALIRHSRVGEHDSLEAFAPQAKDSGVPESRLIDLALYAPHWSRHLEQALGVSGLSEGVWWVRAHTKDTAFRVEREIEEVWDASIAVLTPIPKEDLADGAVDAAWFARIHKALGPRRWGHLYDAAKFACGGAGHKRAQLFADAMLGEISEAELVSRINAKRHQDSVRALGLVPLRKGNAGRKQVLDRYRLMQEFRRTSRKHGGSMLQASEKRAVEIGMENLARLAGYPDPLRLQWAMETREIADLAKGPLSVKVGDTRVTLAIDEDGVAALSAHKGEKSLANVPPAVKKQQKIKELSSRLADLRRQGSRMRAALEQAMCRGDQFEARELGVLWEHPILRPMIARLVFTGAGTLMGYPDDGGRTLRGHSGKREPLAAGDVLRIAHPLDLLAGREWHLWQKECFDAERVQAFKQVFREVYVPTVPERGGQTEALRYQGHQVQPRQALALLGSRGWVARPEEGVQRTFHKERVTAFATFEEYFFTPGDVEGLTVRGVVFVQSGASEPLPLAGVPGRLFSEVMRDLDLVVSVAHRGGVDPEASQSSVELRAALLRETCELLGLRNVRVEERFAKITGELGEYALHLGSANVQRLPGGSLLISPVFSQHRGRLFLPFADDDPKTAEVITKAITLARDSEIKDPAILAQIRG